jgi:hypothetical protein
MYSDSVLELLIRLILQYATVTLQRSLELLTEHGSRKALIALPHTQVLTESDDFYSIA